MNPGLAYAVGLKWSTSPAPTDAMKNAERLQRFKQAVLCASA